jgi:hypothetical protein
LEHARRHTGQVVTLARIVREVGDGATNGGGAGTGEERRR